MKKKDIENNLRVYADGGGLITKAQVSRFFGLKRSTARIDNLLSDLPSLDGKYYLVAEVADVIYRRMM